MKKTFLIMVIVFFLVLGGAMGWAFLTADRDWHTRLADMFWLVYSAVMVVWHACCGGGRHEARTRPVLR